MEKRKLIELIIGEENEGLPVEAISLVKFPAIEENFVFFSKGKGTMGLSLAAVQEDKRTLIGPALIPEKEIPRFDDDTGEEYDVYFSPDTVRLASEMYMKHSRQNSHTFEHERDVEDVHVVESWIVEEPAMDKSKHFGMEMPKGTWMVRVHVANDEMWDEVKNGSIRGFSIEGYFIDKVEEMSQSKPKERMSKTDETMATKLWKHVLSMVGRHRFYSEIILDNGVVLSTEDDAFTAGTVVKKIDDKGEPVDMPNGKYQTKAGIELEVFDNVLIEWDGEVEAVEETQVETEDDEVVEMDKVELDQEKVKFWRQYMDAKMKQKFGMDTKKRECSDKINLESYPWDQCIADQMETYGDMETAERVCGSIKAKYGG